MSSPEKNRSEPGLIETLSSLQFGLVVLITIACVAVIGTVIPQGRSPEFYREHFNAFINFLIRIFRFDVTYRSPLFLGLLGLFGLNLFLCTLVRFPALLRKTFRPNHAPDADAVKGMPVSHSLTCDSLERVERAFGEAGFRMRRTGVDRLFGEKGRFGYLGAFTVHLSLMILLVGGVISLVTGFRGYITLFEGESTAVAMLSENYSVPLGFEIALDRFEVSFYDDFPGRPKSYVSSVTVTLPDGNTQGKDIRVNDPLMLNHYTVYQSSYGVSDESFMVPASDDTARVALLVKGVPESMPPIVTLDMVMGETYTVPGFGDSLTVRLAELHRDFRGAAAPTGELNPAVKIDVLVNGETRWSIYSFSNYPGLNMPMYDDIMVSFSLREIRAGESTGEIVETGDYYTVLGVVRDRGIPLMWIGAVFMMLGLFLSFYVRPRRIWVLRDGDRLLVGGTVKGDSKPFGKFARNVLAAGK